MNITNKLLLSLMCVISASACGSADEATNEPPEKSSAVAAESAMSSDTSTRLITGSVSYRERIALGPKAELNLRLEDVSLADAPATLIAEKNMLIKGSVPVRFELTYDPALISERNSYAVRATIKENGRMLFTTDTHYPVLTRNGGDTVDLVLVSTGNSTQPAATLTDTDWLLTAIVGETISVPANADTPYLRLTAEGNIVQGFSGCNRYSGTWQLNGDTISFGPLAMTMMACADDDAIESRFMPALEKASNYVIAEQELIMSLDGKELLRFKSGN
ncbi:MAG: YbaY family lipoprotein [Gammaproteobacteria bacterium]